MSVASQLESCLGRDRGSDVIAGKGDRLPAGRPTMRQRVFGNDVARSQQLPDGVVEIDGVPGQRLLP